MSLALLLTICKKGLIKEKKNKLTVSQSLSLGLYILQKFARFVSIFLTFKYNYKILKIVIFCCFADVDFCACLVWDVQGLLPNDLHQIRKINH